MAKAAKPRAREYQKRRTRTKIFHHYVNPERDYDVKCREVSRLRDEEIHFPFDTRSGQQKYNKL